MDTTEPRTREAEAEPGTPRSLPPGDERESRERLQASGTTAVAALLGVAFVVTFRAVGAPLWAITVPAALLGAIFAFARPAATVSFMVFLTGFIGTLIAHTGIAAEGLAQSLLVCLWLAVIYAYATGRYEGRLWIWPGLALSVLYLAITIVEVLAAENIGAAFTGFKLSGWYMLAFLLVAIAPWPSATFRRAVRGVVLITVGVGIYAVFRKIAGSSTEEIQLAYESTGIRRSEAIRFFGSFLGPQQLAAWGAAAIPFLLGVAIAWRGRWRGAAILGLVLCTFAVIASDIRTGVVAAVVGVALVLLLLQLCNAFKGPRLAVGLTALIGIVAVAAAGYAITLSGSDASEQRFENLLSPGDDAAYQERTARWERAIDDINGKPLGHGMGTAGYAGAVENPGNFAGPINLDSSYLKIGLEQGWPVLALFVVALLALFGGIARRAIATPDRWTAAIGIGACGTLATQVVLYYASTYVEGIPALFAWILIGLGAAPFTFVPESAEEPAAPSDDPVQGRPAGRPVSAHA